MDFPTIFEQVYKACSGQMKAEDTNETAISDEFSIALANNRDFANLTIATAFGGIFKVDAVLVTSLCPAFFDDLGITAEERHVATDMFISLPDVHPFYMDRMINYMYYRKYDTVSPTTLSHLQDGCQLALDASIAFGTPAALELEVCMCIIATELRSTILRDYTLMEILELFEEGVSIEEFDKAVELTYLTHPGNRLLQQTLAVYAALEYTSGYPLSPAAACEILQSNTDFIVEVYLAGQHIDRMIQQGSLPAL